jgi:hypothetical protein
MNIRTLLRVIWPYPGNADYQPDPVRAAEALQPTTPTTTGPRGGGAARPAPGHTPTHLITLNPRACSVCGDPMPFGIAHYCGLGADIRPERAA